MSRKLAMQLELYDNDFLNYFLLLILLDDHSHFLNIYKIIQLIWVFFLSRDSKISELLGIADKYF